MLHLHGWWIVGAVGCGADVVFADEAPSTSVRNAPLVHIQLTVLISETACVRNKALSFS